MSLRFLRPPPSIDCDSRGSATTEGTNTVPVGTVRARVFARCRERAGAGTHPSARPAVAGFGSPLVRSHELGEAIADPGRLAAVRRLDGLGGAPSPAMDRLTSEAAAALRVPVAAVSLIDAHRQYFLSAVGLGERARSALGISLDHSICQHVVARAWPAVVADARVEPAFEGVLAASELGFVAYAGTPLITWDGWAVGAFAVADFDPRRSGDRDLAMLGGLATAAVDALTRRVAGSFEDREVVRQGWTATGP